MSVRASALFLALLLSVVLLPRASFGGPDEAETKQARKDLKKHLKQLGAVTEALVKADARLDLNYAAPKADEEGKAKIESEMGDLRTKAGELVAKIAAADNADASEALLQYATTVADPDVYERTRSEMTRLTSDEAVKVLASTLGGDLVEEEGKKRGKKGAVPVAAQVLVARLFDAIESPLTIPPLAAQIEKGTAPPVVNACVAVAGKKQDPRLIKALIALLGRVEVTGGNEYYRVRQALVDQTGQDFLTKERWEKWWAENQTGFDYAKKGDAKEAKTRERAPEEKVPAFFGTEIASNRVCFVVDCSGSMVMTDRPPESSETDEQLAKKNPEDPAIRPLERMTRARTQLKACIEALQPTQRFNVIAFSGANKMWQPTVVAATADNKAAALTFADGMRANGGTNTYDALRAAFELKDEAGQPAIDTIYFLSDGAPMIKMDNAGDQMRMYARDQVHKIMSYVDKENRFRGVVIHTFGMDGPGVWHTKMGARPPSLPTESDWLQILSSFMRELAAKNGGEFKSI